MHQQNGLLELSASCFLQFGALQMQMPPTALNCEKAAVLKTFATKQKFDVVDWYCTHQLQLWNSAINLQITSFAELRKCGEQCAAVKV